MVLKVRKLVDTAVLPQYAHPGDAGLDLCACESLTIPAGEVREVRTGLALELPPGTEGQVRPRSGLALRHAVTLLNAPGTVDEGYRGEVRVLVINHGREAFRVEPGLRIAQLVVARCERVCVEPVETLSETARGAGGFGSTGTAPLPR